ncbi:BolA/IbaG family iron-sulfur metabolism protein [Spongiibacter sp. KMU-158]|uniref:BolA/IbaG family iron-sulfur metabolism protein n=1 Tax=Spongiibacter pelagi TaxID=2760804 RepID=A0A927GWG3_9GAMM|nr:BolA/IbaG family iron-sulfur metabolism protein [Spongiibacter pelagi]MBD2859711.1 BolA/IbaG family iron-sulfur metabolism protein [Spongiibacter pelagi]
MQEQISEQLKAHFTDATIEVGGDGSHFDVKVVSDVFEGLRPVKRQQMVYAALNDMIRDGSVHAVNIKALTVAEA